MTEFDTNVQAVMDFLGSKGYSASVISQHRLCYREFRKYLLDNGISYSRAAADAWIDFNSSTWKYQKTTSYTHCIDQLDDVYCNGRVSNDHLGPQKAPYSLLETDLKNELDEYLRATDLPDGSRTLEQRRVYCSRFMLYLQKHGIHSLTEADYTVVLSFHEDDFHRSYKTKDTYEDEIRALLRYSAGIGRCPIGLSLVLNKQIIPQLITDPSLIRNEMPPDSDRISWETVRDFLSELAKIGYSKTVLKSSCHTLTLLFLFFDMHHISFNEGMAWDWFSRAKPLLKKNWKQARRTLNQFLYYLNTGTVITSTTGDRDRKIGIDLLPEWSQEQLKGFLDLLSREGRSKSTTDMYRSSVVRFCRYLESIGRDSFSDLTAEDLVNFNLQDSHTTTEGKAAYNCRIRNFLIYLTEEGVIRNPSLYRALPTISAPKVRIVETLDDEEVQKIWESQNAKTSPQYLRDYAIVCIGIGMGMRASDIVNLRFENIDWKSRSFHFIQQKTGKAVTLPFPIHIGNAVYRYLKEGRPKSESPYLFILHKAPYGKLNRVACRGALTRILPERTVSGGFHVTRKTFATNLLKNGTKVTMISESLGHRNDDTVHKYLSLDEARMRECPLSLQEAGIPLEGGGSFA